MKNKFIYKDNSQTIWLEGKHVAPVIFKCISSSIGEADKLFDQALNDGTIILPAPPKTKSKSKSNSNSKKEKKIKGVVSMPHIGCSLKPLSWWEKILDAIHAM